MSNYHLFQDTRKCINCKSCEVVCKANKSLPHGPKPCQVVEVGPRWTGGVPRMSYIFMPCFHCENPWCVGACPTHAMQIREVDGIVWVDKELCVGCKACVKACPWGAPQWNPKEKKIVKCDYCMDRVDQGLEPACVTVCTTHCLSFGTVDDDSKQKRQGSAEKVASADATFFMAQPA